MSAISSAQAARELTTKSYFLLLQDAAKSVPQRVQSSLSYCLDLSIMIKHKRIRVDYLMKRLFDNSSSSADGLKSDEVARISKELVSLLTEIAAIRDKESLTLEGTAAHIDDAASQLDDAFQRGEVYFRHPRQRAVGKDSDVVNSSHVGASTRVANGTLSSSVGDSEKQNRSPIKHPRRETSTSRNRGLLKKQRFDKDSLSAKSALILSKSQKMAREKYALKSKDKATKASSDQETSPSSHSSLERSSKNALLEAAACLSGNTKQKERIKQPRVSARNMKTHAISSTSTPNIIAASDRLSMYEFGPTTPPISPPGALDALRAVAQAVGGQISSSTTTSGDDDTAGGGSVKWKPRRNVSVARQASNISAASAGLPSASASAVVTTRDRPNTSSNSTSLVSSGSSPAYDRKISYSELQKREPVDAGVPIIISSSMATTRSPATATDAPPQSGERKEHAVVSSISKPRGSYVRRKPKDGQERRKASRGDGNTTTKRRKDGEKPLSARVKQTSDKITTSRSRKAERNMPTEKNSKRRLDDDTISETRNAAAAEISTTSSSHEASPAPTLASNTTTLTTRGTIRKVRRSAVPGSGRRGAANAARQRRQSGSFAADAGENTKSAGASSAKEPLSATAVSSLPLQAPSRRKPTEPKLASHSSLSLVKNEAEQQSTTYVRSQEFKLTTKRASPKDEESSEVAMLAATTNAGEDAHVGGGQFDQERVCFCRHLSYGQMVACDDSTCKIEWFHFECVGLKATPRGKWYCPNCRGEKPHILKSSSSSAGTS